MAGGNYGGSSIPTVPVGGNLITTAAYKDYKCTSAYATQANGAFTYGGVTFNENSNALSVTGSKFELKATDSSDLFTLYNSSDEVSVQFDDKVIVLGAKTGATPTPVAGGLFYSGSDAFYLGFEGSGLP